MLTRLLSQFKIFSRFAGGADGTGIHSVSAFSRIIERERERADRTGLDVSLVVFEVSGKAVDTESMREVAATLLYRIRTTDEVGWYDSDRIGALLPHTGWGDARRFAEIIQGHLSGRAYSLSCRIFSYPSSWPNGWNGRHYPTEQLTFSDYSKNWSTNSKKADISLRRSKRTGAHVRVQRGAKKVCKAHGGGDIVLSEEPLCFFPLPFWKRALDIAGALTGIVLLLPLFLLICVLIKILSPGPVFFRQERVGYLGGSFSMLKFRTMHTYAKSSSHREYLSELMESDRQMTKLDDREDPRIFNFGKILRKTALDELPQLLNVLYGEMSLVGPRPCLPYEAERYLLWHARRFDSVPGLTGLWQVSGKNKTTFKEMIRLDIQYARNRSLFMDLSIILKTIPTVLTEATEGLLRRKETEYVEEH